MEDLQENLGNGHEALDCLFHHSPRWSAYFRELVSLSDQNCIQMCDEVIAKVFKLRLMRIEPFPMFLQFGKIPSVDKLEGLNAVLYYAPSAESCGMILAPESLQAMMT